MPIPSSTACSWLNEFDGSVTAGWLTLNPPVNVGWIPLVGVAEAVQPPLSQPAWAPDWPTGSVKV